MSELSDAELLRDYAERRNEAAFRELVTRHADLVYSAALRQVASPDLAADVAQTVFTDLARKARAVAGQLAEGASLVGWLYRGTRFAALNQLRADRRRLTHERQAMDQLLINSEPAPDWERIRPLLDEAMASLGDADRDAVLLRYFKRQEFRAVGGALGISEDAAQKRVSRAVERLRDFFTQRGVTLTGATIAGAVSANAVQAVPLGLAAKIAAAALLAGTIPTTTITTSTIMNWINAKTIAAMLASALASGTATYFVQQGEVSRLRAENQNLLAKQKQISRERDTTSVAANDDRQELERLRKNQSELLRLRSQVGQLRQREGELRAQVPAAQSQALAKSETSLSVEESVRICTNNLRTIHNALKQCALENKLAFTNLITTEQILPYLRGHQFPQCPSGGTYRFANAADPPTCSIPGHILVLAEPTPPEQTTMERVGIIWEAYSQDHLGQPEPHPSVLADAEEAYKRDHSGQAPNGSNGGPEDLSRARAELLRYVPPGERFKKALDDYKRDHDGQSITNMLDLAPYLAPYLQSAPQKGP